MTKQRAAPANATGAAGSGSQCPTTTTAAPASAAIADQAPSDARDDREHTHAEDVEAVLHTHRRAADCEHCRAGEIEGEQEGAGWNRPGRRIHVSVAERRVGQPGRGNPNRSRPDVFLDADDDLDKENVAAALEKAA